MQEGAEGRRALVFQPRPRSRAASGPPGRRRARRRSRPARRRAAAARAAGRRQYVGQHLGLGHRVRETEEAVVGDDGHSPRGSCSRVALLEIELEGRRGKVEVARRVEADVLVHVVRVVAEDGAPAPPAVRWTRPSIALAGATLAAGWPRAPPRDFRDRLAREGALRGRIGARGSAWPPRESTANRSPFKGMRLAREAVVQRSGHEAAVAHGHREAQRAVVGVLRRRPGLAVRRTGAKGKLRGGGRTWQCQGPRTSGKGGAGEGGKARTMERFHGTGIILRPPCRTTRMAYLVARPQVDAASAARRLPLRGSRP